MLTAKEKDEINRILLNNRSFDIVPDLPVELIEKILKIYALLSDGDTITFVNDYIDRVERHVDKNHMRARFFCGFLSMMMYFETSGMVDSNSNASTVLASQLLGVYISEYMKRYKISARDIHNHIKYCNKKDGPLLESKKWSEYSCDCASIAFFMPRMYYHFFEEKKLRHEKLRFLEVFSGEFFKWNILINESILLSKLLYE